MSYKLNTGHTIPLVGFGTWQAGPHEVEKAVETAIKAGYRHIDLAKVYQNQTEIARGIKAGGVKREELFITSKLWNTAHRPQYVEAALDDTLKELDLTYLDLYLIHWPVPFDPSDDPNKNLFPLSKADDSKTALDVGADAPSVVDTWKAVTKLVATGKVKSVGVSNFTPALIDVLIAETGVTPAVNQIERHPLLIQPELLKHHKEKGIHITAYSLLGNNMQGKPLLVENATVKSIAEKLGATPAQVLIAWAIQGTHSAIPKSVTPSRIESNFKLVDLSAEDIAELDKLGETPVRYNIPITYGKSWDINVFGEEVEKSATYQVKV